MPRRQPRILEKRNASQVARAPGAVVSKGFVRMCIKLAGARVPLNGSIELRRVEGLEPRTKPREFARAELFDGLFDVFGGGHDRDIAFGRGAEKGGGRNGNRVGPINAKLAEYAALFRPRALDASVGASGPHDLK